jgi:hypothetical protein
VAEDRESGHAPQQKMNRFHGQFRQTSE